ncbi:MAG: hypothetical protein V4490_06995, partial [Pseudomonadota bacterium]
MSLLRGIQLITAVERFGISQALGDAGIPYPFRWIRLVMPWLWWQQKPTSLPIAVRLCCESLGPLFIKFGQVLSS